MTSFVKSKSSLYSPPIYFGARFVKDVDKRLWSTITLDYFFLSSNGMIINNLLNSLVSHHEAKNSHEKRCLMMNLIRRSILSKSQLSDSATVCKRSIFVQKLHILEKLEKCWKNGQLLFLCQNWPFGIFSGQTIEIFEFSPLNWSKIDIS